MRKYFCFFRNRFQVGLQYRTAALAALCTQFLWGLMECVAYTVLLGYGAVDSPMELSALISYIWLKEAFFALFNTWMTDNDLFNLLIDGGIVYELCRPVSIYNMWYARNVGGRMSAAAMRCVPILAVAFLLPRPYRMSLPGSMVSLILFLLTMVLGMAVTVAFCMLVYMLAFFTISPQGLRMVMMGAVDLLAGSIVPIPFIPQPVRGILERLPFASMMNVPLRIYSGDLIGQEMMSAILLQCFWLAVLVAAGKGLCRLAERKVIVQGG